MIGLYADPMTEFALCAEALSRSFRVRGATDRTALDNVDLELAAGHVHGLLGPNGAGKTTLCRIASTVLTPTSGRLLVQGHDVAREPAKVRKIIGIVFGGDRGLYGRLTARENLDFWCAMSGVRRSQVKGRVEELLERFGLSARAGDLVETFSRGMKQRLHLARGLIADPPVLLLDEPTVGMDPISAHEFRTLVTELRGEGRTVLLTTHDMAEAQSLCDTVTFIDAGKVVGTGTPDTVRALRSKGGVQVRVHDVSQTSHKLLVDSLPKEVTGQHDQNTRSTDLLVATADVHAVVSTVMALGHLSITTGAPSLEDVYLSLLGRKEGSGRGMAI